MADDRQKGRFLRDRLYHTMYAFFLGGLLFLAAPVSPESLIDTVVGGVEMVYLNPPGRWYRGRIDTGAALCSLNAFDITEFDKDGALWVRFNMASLLDTEDVIQELPVERVVMVRQGNREDLQKRYIVLIQAVLGPLELEEEFSLSDRRHMTSSVLIGRNFLSGHALVDVSREFIYQ